MLRVVLVAMAVAMAGCGKDAAPTADEAKPSARQGDLEAPGDSAAKQSSGGGKGTAGNKRPLLTFAADVTQGDGPLHVRFTMKALDDDGDRLRWRLDADGEGTTDAEGDINGTVTTTYTYRVKGTYTARAVVTDGRDEVEASVAISVLSSEPIQTEDADLVLQVEGCFLPTAYNTVGTVPGGTGSALGGVGRLEFAVEPLTVGRPFVATWTFDTGYLSMGWFFVDASGTVVAGETDDNPNFGSYVQQGTVPEKAAHGVFFGCGGPAQAHVEYVA